MFSLPQPIKIAALPLVARNDEIELVVFMEKLPTVYIITNKAKTVLYTGVTSDLIKRISQYREGIHNGFAKRYNCNILVYYEQFGDMENAILREKQIKAGSRKKKDALVNAMNSEWKDLFPSLF